MLSRRERETLAVIETRLSSESPQLAAEFTRLGQQGPGAPGGRGSGRRIRPRLVGAIVMLAVLGLVCTLGGSVFGGVVLGVSAVSLGMYLVYDLSRPTAGG